MADDIDIEEHNLMEDPDVSGIFPDFPDLDVVKTEVIDIEDGFEEQRRNALLNPSTSVIPDSTSDVDYHPPRTTDSPHIISSTSVPESPEEITDRLILKDLVTPTETILSTNDADVNISICEEALTEELDLSVDVSVNDISNNEKPVVSAIVDEFVDVINDNDNDKVVGNDEAFFGNCIILGSKSVEVDREEFYEDEKCFNSFVALQDWGPYLSESDCYCSECEILFATVNALDFHKMQAHSHLVAVSAGDEDGYASDDSPKDDTGKAACSLCNSVLATKSGLQKHMRLMHNPNSIPSVRSKIILGTKKAKELNTSTNYFNVNKPLRTYAVKSSGGKAKKVEEEAQKREFVCFVCQYQCLSDDELIEHLYKLHTFRCEVCNTVFAKKDEYDEHMLTQHPQLTIKQQTTDKTVESLKTAPSLGEKLSISESEVGFMVRRCDGCPAQFSKMLNLRKHFVNYKMKWKEPLVPNQAFDPVCPVCCIEITNRKKFNIHVLGHDCHGYANKLKVAKCKFCPAQFGKSKMLMDHFETVHKITYHRIPRLDRVFNPKCPYCPKTFTLLTHFNKHLEAHHCIDITTKKVPVELTEDKAAITLPSPLKLPLHTSTKVSFKCLKCDVQFPDLLAANIHKESVHSKVNNEIIKKVTHQIALIQTKYLFRCDTCDVHFTSPSLADVHAKSNCKEQQSCIPCKQCELKINMNDVASHSKKHEISDELTVIDISEKDLNARVLCKCPSCRLHFKEGDYQSHYIECSTYSHIPYWCVFCKLYIDIKAQTSHDHFHYELKLKKEALIILEYKEIVKSSVFENINETDNVVDKIGNNEKHTSNPEVDIIRMDIHSKEYADKMAAIKLKTQGIYKLIECTFCETFRSFNLESASDHLGGQCKRKIRRPCNLCGIRVLNIAIRLHKADHSSYPALNFNETLFFDECLNIIKPHVPKLFKCHDCSVSFESKYHLDRHTCENTKKQRCVQCNVDIVHTYYTYHIQYHEYQLPKLSGLEYAAPRYEKNNPREFIHKQEACSSKQYDDESKDQNKTQTKSGSAFLQSYKPNKKIFLYQCKKCKLSSVSGNFRELHVHCSSKRFTCNICELQFAMTYRRRHQLFHIKHPNVNFDSFHIQEFARENILKRPKTTINVGLETQKNRPISYKNKRLLKMRGISVFYQCIKCKLVSIGRKFTVTHTTCVKYANTYTCDLCGYTCSPDHMESHIRWHIDNPNLKKEHIILSRFSPGFGNRGKTQMVKSMPITNKLTMVQRRPALELTKEAKFQSVEKKTANNGRPEEDSSSNKKVTNESSVKKPNLFQCKKCNISSISVTFPHAHNNCENILSYDCDRCGIKFFDRFKRAHREFHLNTRNASSNHYNIIRFNPDTVFRPISTTRHYELSKTGKVILVQCVKCNLTSSSRTIMTNHLSCDNTQAVYNCKLCGYNLVMSERVKHSALHANSPHLKRSDILVTQFDPEIERQFLQVDEDLPSNGDKNVNKGTKSSAAVVQQTKSSYIIFRCEICDVCTEEGMDHECKEGIRKVVCGICSLTFEDAFYGSHAAKHKDPNYNKKVEIIHIEGETPSHYRKRKALPINETPTKIPKISEAATPGSFASDEDDGLDKIFKCICGLHFLKLVSCSNHMRTCNLNPNKQPINVCKYCNISLHSVQSLKDHITGHHNAKIDFKIITVNLGKNKKVYKCNINETPIMNPRLSEVASSEASFAASDNDDDGVDTIIKCRCDLHFLSRRSCSSHFSACNPVHKREAINVCSYCRISFHSPKSLEEHTMKHHEGHIEFRVVRYKDYGYKKIIIYKCQDCDLLFPSFDNFKSNMHLASCGVATGVKCRVCRFDIMESFVDEHAKIHAVGRARHADKFKVVVVSKDKIPTNIPPEDCVLYKCTKCEVHFLNMDGIECHYPCESSSRRQTKCPDCGLKFYSASLYAHVLAQHTKLNYDINDLVIKKIEPKEDPAMEVNTVITPKDDDDSIVDDSDSIPEQKATKKRTLYQCIECKVNFVNYKVMYNHRSCSVSNPAINFTCEQCNMTIYLPDKGVHYLLHHSEENNLTDESDYAIHKKNSHQKSSTPRKPAEKYPVFGCRSVKGAIKTGGGRLLKSIVKSRKILDDEEEDPRVLYKCYECDICFIFKNSILKHSPKYAAHDGVKNKMECDVCGLHFGPRILTQHKILHHDELKLKLEDFKFLTIEDVRNETLQESDMSISESDTSVNTSVDTSISKRNNAVARKSLGLIEATKIVKESSPAPSPKLDEHNKVKLYKCKDCNVNFLKQNLCYRHVINHEPLSTYDFLECKICTLNFPIQYLQQHMAQHKTKEFGLKDILIEEYEALEHSSPGSKRSTPKIDIYNAIDRDGKNMIKTEVISSDLTEMQQDSNTVSDISNAESNVGEISKTPVEPNTKNENCEPSILQRLLVSKNIPLEEIQSSNSSIECKDIKIESVVGDVDTKSLESSSKDDTSLQSMDIECDNIDGKILNG